MGPALDLVTSASMYARNVETGASTAFSQFAQTVGSGLTYIAGMSSQYAEQANLYKKTATDGTQSILTGFLDLVIGSDTTFSTTENSSLRGLADGMKGLLSGTMTAENAAGFLVMKGAELGVMMALRSNNSAEKQKEEQLAAEKAKEEAERVRKLAEDQRRKTEDELSRAQFEKDRQRRFLTEPEYLAKRDINPRHSLC
jgi:hypothetical protein